MITCSSIKFSRNQMGYDLRRNESVSEDYEDVFSTNMYAKEAVDIIRSHDKSKPLYLYLAFMALHTPLVGLPPKKLRKKFSRNAGRFDIIIFLPGIILFHHYRGQFEESPHEVRDIVLASLDDAVYKVVRELQSAGMYDNSVILVTTDNGGGPWYSNTPLRGTKETLYEGGIRAASFLLSPLLQRPGRRYDGFLHLVDWTPTFLRLAGLKDATDDIDGQDVWDSINNDEPVPRESIIHNIDEMKDKGRWQATISRGSYKMIWGQDYLLKKSQKNQETNIQLYNVVKDPNESNNIADENRDIIDEMKEIVLSAKQKRFVEADYPDGSKAGWPSNFDGIVSTNWCKSN